MSQGTTSTRTVLIADDDLDILGVLRGMLRAKKVSVIEANNGDEAMALVLEHEPDLVILDVMMPGQSGWEVCRSIRERVDEHEPKIIMLTGIGERVNEATSPLYGADAHLDKPFDVDELSALIDQLLAR